MAHKIDFSAPDFKHRIKLVTSGRALPIFIKQISVAGWSSPVARRAHNPKVVGSNPAPATNFAPAELNLSN